MDKIINIVIIDDHPVVLQGFCYLLKNISEMCVVGCFTNAKDAIAFFQTNFADIVLLDINLPDKNGIELCNDIKRISPYSCIIAISNSNEHSIITRMLQNGASGYILKNASVEEVVYCIKTALSGKLAISADVQKILAKPCMKELRNTPKLTRREKEILKLIAAGHTTPKIAEQLYISPLTVETHRRNLMQKFQVSNAAALVHMAAEYKLLE